MLCMSDTVLGVMLTCLEDLGLVLCHSSGLTQSHFVFCKDSELVSVAHDEVRDGGVQSMVMLQHGEPVLGKQCSRP